MTDQQKMSNPQSPQNSDRSEIPEKDSLQDELQEMLGDSASHEDPVMLMLQNGVSQRKIFLARQPLSPWHRLFPPTSAPRKDPSSGYTPIK